MNGHWGYSAFQGTNSKIIFFGNRGMDHLECNTMYRRNAGVIEVELCSFAPSQTVMGYTNGPRAILGLSLPPYPARRRVRYKELGPKFHDIGNVILTPPLADCQFLGSGSRSFAFRCYFEDETFRNVTNTPDIWTAGLLLKTLDIGGKAGAQIDLILRLMARELETPSFATETMIEGLGLTTLVHLARHVNGQDAAMPNVRGRLSPMELRLLSQYVDEKQGRAPTITDLSRQCEMGPRRFTTLFKATTGQTVKSWVDNRRMDKARRLLAETRLPMKSIAFDLGFSNQSVFSTAFRIRAGVSPSEYRAAFS